MPNYPICYSTGARSEMSICSRNETSECSIPSGSILDYYKRKDGCGCRLKETILRDFELFKDREFPAEKDSLGPRSEENIEWLRPHNIVPEYSYPQFFVNGPPQLNVKQGRLKNCWFLAAVASLTMNEDLLYHVVPRDQSFDNYYTGLFRFRFWQYGKWVDVVVDDYLPTYKENGKIKIRGSQPVAKNEFWIPLLEKAYAKLHGSYQAIQEPGWPSDAMEDFTGGLSEYYAAKVKTKVDIKDIANKEKKEEEELGLWEISKKASDSKSLVTCVLKVDSQKKEANEERNNTSPNNWSITRFIHDSTTDDKTENFLIGIRYPYVDRPEFSKKSAEGSKNCKTIPKSDMKLDGEFFMCKKEFEAKCVSMEICHLDLIKISDTPAEKVWNIYEFEGEWSGVEGGAKNNPSYFAKNPQYRFKVKGKTTVTIALTQKHSRTKNRMNFLEIGCLIFPMGQEDKLPLTSKYFSGTRALNSNNEFRANSAPEYREHEKYTRESSCRLELIEGDYCIVPHTNFPNEKENYYLRVFSDRPTPAIPRCEGST